jgi:hypothetical protein
MGPFLYFFFSCAVFRPAILQRWYVTLCSLVNFHRRVGGMFRRHLQVSRSAKQTASKKKSANWTKFTWNNRDYGTTIVLEKSVNYQHHHIRKINTLQQWNYLKKYFYILIVKYKLMTIILLDIAIHTYVTHSHTHTKYYGVFTTCKYCWATEISKHGTLRNNRPSGIFSVPCRAVLCRAESRLACCYVTLR